MYKLEFINSCEIRMGSPFNIADVKLTGQFVPNFDGIEFQDKGRTSESKNEVLLVQWMIIDNDPGFIVWKISATDHSIKKSSRISGCCQNIEFQEQGNATVTIRNSVDDSRVALVAFK